MPVLETTGQAESRLMLVNAAAEAADVTLTARSYSGTLLTGNGVINPVSITLEPSSSRALRAKEIFGAAASGWVELQTASPAVSGAFFLSDSKQNASDGASLLASPASRLIFPKATTDIASANNLVLINTSNRTLSNVVASLYENSGRLVAEQRMTLAAFAGFSGSVSSLVPSLRNFDGYVVVESNSSEGVLIGFETYRPKTDIPAPRPVFALLGPAAFDALRYKSDIAVLPAATEAARLGTGYVPQFGDQAGVVSTLVLLNYGNVSQTIHVTGTIVEVKGDATGGPSIKTAQQTLAPYERLELRLDQLFSFNSQKSLVSLVRFETDGAMNGGSGLFSYLETKTHSGSTALMAQESGYSDISFSNLENGVTSYTGLTLVNPGPQGSAITVDAFDPRGNRIDSVAVTLDPNSRWSGLIHQLLSDTQAQNGGRLHITASSPIFAVQILGSALTGALTVVPAQGSMLPPLPSDQPVSAETGGTVMSDDGSASLSIPPKALSQNTPIRISRLNIADFPPPPRNERLIGMVEGTPAGTRFRIPARLRFSLTEHIEPGTTINVLIFNPATRQYDPSEFVAIVEQSGWTATADVMHFTKFALAAPVTSVKISALNPSKALVESTITISGSGFSLTPSLNTVLFTGPRGVVASTSALTSTSTSLTTKVPSNATSGKVYVEVGSVKSNGVRFTVTTLVNQAPEVNAGQDQTVALPSGVALSGTATDDGLPAGSSLTATWNVYSGPGSVTFGDATALSTPVSFSGEGTYVLRLTVSDGERTSSDDLAVTVTSPAPSNEAPSVNAGANQTITLPSGVNLTGTATDDGLPSGVLTAAWTKFSGPGTVTFGNPTAFTTTATFSAGGTYTLRLTASDGSLSSSADVVIIVSAGNQAPVVNAGPDQTITVGMTNLAGSATDDGLPSGSTLTTTWSKLSGPGTVTFGNVNARNTTASFVTVGTYVLRLTATDGMLTSSNDVTITVNPCGLTVSGTVTVSANASDNVGVTSMQFTLLQSAWGYGFVAAPYSTTWDTTQTPNGCYTITAVAQDAAGNQGTAFLQVSVSNP
jgi:hypothetical protein